ncbi:MAG TPA: peptidylprolyl isomerase [Hyphomicrobium sp.]
MHPVFSNRRVLAAIAVVAVTFLAGPLQAVSAEEKADDKIVAKVNGKPITEAEMKFAEGEIGSELASLPAEVKRRALAEYLIDNALFAEAAEAEKLGSTPEFEEQMRYLRQRMLREQYFEKTLKGTVSEDEAKKIYDTRVASLKIEEEVAARHLLVDSEEKAKDLRAKIVGGADFAEVAKENSTDPGSKEQGGMLGYFTKGQMVPEFEAAVFKLHKGEISEPVKTNFGWHIIKLEDRRRKVPPTFESVKDTIMNSLAVRKAQEKAVELRKSATLDYVDPDIKKQIEAEAAKKKDAEAKPEAKPEAAPEQ